ncbi:hypothetical protein BHE74_00045251 [Ensete ventricosum]|nr:hypothetical protein GW17_00007172 [Ensete ventricosum]RWW48655.1 hypothetical protein BHE74_00045251 [Ensete ventricosum]
MWKYPVDPLAGLVGVIEGVILEQLRLEAIVDLAEDENKVKFDVIRQKVVVVVAPLLRRAWRRTGSTPETEARGVSPRGVVYDDPTSTTRSPARYVAAARLVHCVAEWVTKPGHEDHAVGGAGGEQDLVRDVDDTLPICSNQVSPLAKPRRGAHTTVRSKPIVPGCLPC